VAALGRAVLEGLAAGGVTGCIKHMPGHGRSEVDTHKALPIVTASAAELEADLAPFRTLNQALIGMTGHLKFTAWDAENPATLSPTIIADIIRGSIGFDGLLLSDDIDMEALGGTIPQRAARAHAAGCDIVLNCWAKMDDMAGICDVLPALSEHTAARLDRALAETRIAPGLAPQAAELLAKRDALLALTGTKA
jgi:beta-N-acetylhexosaminidase